MQKTKKFVKRRDFKVKFCANFDRSSRTLRKYAIEAKIIAPLSTSRAMKRRKMQMGTFICISLFKCMHVCTQISESLRMNSGNGCHISSSIDRMVNKCI